MSQRQLWMLVGGNGAGKSTFYQTRLEPRGISFVNADVIARQIYPNNPELHSYDAARLTDVLREQLLREGRSFCFETVFSHSSKIDFLARAKALGYETVLVFIHLESASLNQARIAQRVQSGGHYVPEEKVLGRIPRTLENVKKALILCDYAYVLENSRADDPYRRVFTLASGTVTQHMNPLPPWAVQLLPN